MKSELVLPKELLALAVAEAEEDDIHLVERHFRGEAEVCLAYQSLVNFAHVVAGIRLAVGKNNLRFGMPQKHSYQFAARIAGCTKYANLHHSIGFLGARIHNSK